MNSAAIVFGIIGGFFTARTTLTPELSLVSSLAIVVFAIPTYVAWIKTVGLKHALATITILSLFAVGIETIGVRTGWPYGRFFYEDTIGWKIAGVVPWTVPFAWVPLVLGSYAFVSRYVVQPAYRVFLTAFSLVAIDAVLDPGAFAMRMWIWIDGGVYYGVPAVNFLGWFFSGSIGGLLLYWRQGSYVRTFNSGILISIYLTLAFWSTVAFVKGLYIPFVLGITLLYIGYRYGNSKNPIPQAK